LYSTQTIMVLQCIFVLILLIWSGQACDNNILIGNVAVMAVTSDAQDAGSDSNHQACINHQCNILPDLLGDDMLENKGDFWNMGHWNGMKLCDVFDFRLKQGGNDGWHIAKVTVLIRGNNGRVYVPVFSDSFNQWIDGDGSWDQLETNNLIQSGWKNDLPIATEPVGIQKVYLIAETGHVDDAESDTPHKLEIHFAGISRIASMPDLPGDDMLKHKTDWWTFDSEFDIIDVNLIHDISLRAGGHDAWVPNDVAVLIQTNNGWYVPVLMNDMPVKYLENDNGSDDMAIDLTMIPNWKASPFTGFGDLVGFWEVVQTGNGNQDSISLSSYQGFDENIAEETEQIESFSQEVSAEFGVTVAVGSEFGALSVEQQYSFTQGYTVGSEQTTAIRNSIERSINGGTTQECKFQNANPGKFYVLWGWKTYRKSNILNEGGELQTCNGLYKYGPLRNVEPKCMPGGCEDSENNDCQTCIGPGWMIGGNRRELGEEENTEINGRRNLAETNKKGSAQRLLKMI